jgi:hypothetical protein
MGLAWSVAEEPAEELVSELVSEPAEELVSEPAEELVSEPVASLVIVAEELVNVSVNNRVTRENVSDDIILVKTFYLNKAIASMYTEYDGNLHGEYKIWDELGRLIERSVYNHGEQLTNRRY